MSRSIYYFLVILLMLGCSNKEEFILFNQVDLNQSNQEEVIKAPELDNVEFEYKIVPHDRVSVIIYEHPEFSSSSHESRGNDKGLLVNSKGDIHLPLVKAIHVAGLTQPEALVKIENSFKKYLKNPDVYIEVLNKRAYVIGEVTHPGEIKLENERMPLIQLLAKAGDFKDTANKKAIMILKSSGNRLNSRIVDLTDINSLITANLMIEPNDIVYVLPNTMKSFNAKVNEINPIFRLISNILSPFITIKVLSNAWGK